MKPAVLELGGKSATSCSRTPTAKLDGARLVTGGGEVSA
jgi:hypothetical protein